MGFGDLAGGFPVLIEGYRELDAGKSAVHLAVHPAHEPAPDQRNRFHFRPAVLLGWPGAEVAGEPPGPMPGLRLGSATGRSTPESPQPTRTATIRRGRIFPTIAMSTCKMPGLGLRELSRQPELGSCGSEHRGQARP